MRFLFLFIVFFSTGVEACSIALPPLIVDRLRGASLVFTGRSVSIWSNGDQITETQLEARIKENTKPISAAFHVKIEKILWGHTKELGGLAIASDRFEDHSFKDLLALINRCHSPSRISTYTEAKYWIAHPSNHPANQIYAKPITEKDWQHLKRAIEATRAYHAELLRALEEEKLEQNVQVLIKKLEVALFDQLDKPQPRLLEAFYLDPAQKKLLPPSVSVLRDDAVRALEIASIIKAEALY